jgi:hypothetical protein
MKETNNKELLLLSLSKFYSSNLDKLEEILPIICKSSKISLRLIDWFVTNYCKKYNIVFVRKKNNNTDEYFNVYSNYRSQLKAFKKIQFDPFRRRERIDFYYASDKYIETTIGQLNFFRWFVENDLLEYVKDHNNAIEDDMLLCNVDMNKEKTSNDLNGNNKESSTKSKEICGGYLPKSRSMIKQMTQYKGTTTITFS